MPLRRLLPLLFCPLCAVVDGTAPRPLLRHPFTLHCGHTVCLSHLETLDPAQRCPLPVCTSTPNPNTARPNIPSSSRVVYLPAVPSQAPVQQAASASADQFDQRVDVTISKLIDVVSRHSKPPSPPADHGESDLSDGDDSPERSPPTTTLPSSDEENEFPNIRDLSRVLGRRRRRRPAPEFMSQPTIPNPSASTSTPTTSANTVSADPGNDALPSSGHAGPSCAPDPPTAGGESSDGSDPSTEPPKKRPKLDTRSGEVTDREAQSPAIEPDAETGDLQDAQPNRLGVEPRRDPEGGDEDPQTRIEKELLTELSCDICFTIYYQPVTTPCQHVSCLLFCFCCFASNLSFRSIPVRILVAPRRRHPDVRSGTLLLLLLFSLAFRFIGGHPISPLYLEDLLREMPTKVSGPQEPLSYLQDEPT